MSLTAKFVNNAQNIDIVDEVISLLSEKMNIDKTEAWKTISDKSVEDLRKSVRKPKKKRAKTAYTMFSKDNDVTNKLKATTGGQVSIGEMSRLKSELWKSLSEKEKEKYEQMAKAENEANPVVNEEPKKKKKSRTPYNMFMADKELRDSISKKINTSNMKEVNQEMVKKWKEIKEKESDEYKKYVDLAEKENNKMSEDNEVVKEENEVVKEEPKVVKEEPKVVKEKNEVVKEEPKVVKEKPKKKKTVAKK